MRVGMHHGAPAPASRVLRPPSTATLVLLLLSTSAAFSFHGTATVHHRAVPLLSVRSERTPCCQLQPPPDLDSICEEARTCLREALTINRRRGLTVEASMQSLDVRSRAYDPPVLARFALEVSQALTILDGPLLLLLPGASAVAQARQLLDVEGMWPAGDADRLSVSSLALRGAPNEDETLPAAVVIVGLQASGGADDTTMRDARAWMRAVPTTLSINARLNVPPIEMADFEAAYCLMTYTIAKTDKLKGEEAEK